jgi:cytochrome P450
MTKVDFALDPLPGPQLHAALAGLRGMGPIVPALFLGADAWVITSHAALAEAFRDTVRFPPPAMYQASLEPVVGKTFISMDEPDHQLYRRLATPAFRSRAMARYEESGLAELAHELVDELDGRDEFDLVADFTERFPYLVIARLLGLPRDREGDFHRWALGLLRFRDDAANAQACAAELTRYLAPVVAARRREPREDVISGLVQAEIDGRRLTDDEVYSHVRLLLPTGGETTHGALGNMLYAILTHGDLWQRLRAEPGRIPAVVAESLRWETSIAVLPRLSAPRTTRFFDVELPPNSWVLFAIAAANRDPGAFPDPDRFDPDRDPGDPLTFGPGPKNCPGLHLARKNMTVAAQVLIERIPSLRLVDAVAAEPRGVAPRGPEALRVVRQ